MELPRVLPRKCSSSLDEGVERAEEEEALVGGPRFLLLLKFFKTPDLWVRRGMRFSGIWSKAGALLTPSGRGGTKCARVLRGSGLAVKGISVAEGKLRVVVPLLACMAWERRVFDLRRTVPEVSSGAVKGFCVLRFLNSEAVSGSTLRRRPRLESLAG